MPQPNSSSGLAAVILAGGLGQRLGGVRKASLRIAGISLVERVTAALRSGADPILLATGHHPPITLPPSNLTIAVPDLTPGNFGPVAGLAAAIQWLLDTKSDCEFIVSAAVDSPFLPHDFAQHLSTYLGQAEAAIASYAGQIYPTNGIWRVAALRALPDRIRRGDTPRGLKGLARELNAVTLAWPEDKNGDPFANLNTLYDLRKLASRAIKSE